MFLQLPNFQGGADIIHKLNLLSPLFQLRLDPPLDPLLLKPANLHLGYPHNPNPTKKEIGNLYNRHNP